LEIGSLIQELVNISILVSFDCCVIVTAISTTTNVTVHKASEIMLDYIYLCPSGSTSDFKRGAEALLQQGT